MRLAHRILLLTAVAGVFQASSAFAALVNWPASMAGWTKVTMGGADYTDRLNQASPADTVWASPSDDLDVVGGLDSVGASYTAGFWAVDSVNQVLMFRIRCDSPWSPANDPQSVWTVLINTDGDSFADFGLQLDHKTDERVEIAPTTDFGPSSSPAWGAINDMVVSPQTTVGTITDYARQVDAFTNGDGSQFHNSNAGDHDTFTDVAIPLSQFALITGLQPGDPFEIAFATSSNHNNLNKDKPDGGWSDPITVPEPTTMAISSVVVMGLLLRVRRA